jgi:hypothetical protein
MIKKIGLVAILFMFISCGPVVMIPPEFDLMPYERIGLISFSIENAKGELDKMATQRFLQEITYFQRGVQIIELGLLEDVLGKIDKATLDQEAIQAIGAEFDVTSFFYGEINVSDVKPELDIAGLIRSMRVRATFDISMTARLYSTESGATLWTDSADRKAVLGYMMMGPERIPYFGVRDQEEAYRELTERLVHDLTRDFRPTKRRL